MEKFYRALEDRFRGNKESVKEKTKIYLDLIKKDNILDLGCGRGEFLELLKEKGFKNLVGVDLNPQMTKDIKEIKIIHDDAIETLKKFEDKSFNVITSFHLVEHIEFEKVLTLIKEAYRVLSDDGILIIETPNPENIKVATQNFYIDPTHRNPIPYELLKFSFEYFGFFARILRKETSINNSIKDLIENVSPDYAIVGFKNIKDIDEEFFNRGVSLDLAEFAFEERIKNLEERVNKIDIKLQQEDLKNEINKLKIENNHLKAENNHLKAENNHLKAENNNLMQELENIKTLYENIINSKSWKITKPFRIVMNFLKKKTRETMINKLNSSNIDMQMSKRAKEIYKMLKEN